MRLDVNEPDDAFGMAQWRGYGLLDVFETTVEELTAPGQLVTCDVIRVAGHSGGISNFLAFHDHFSHNDRIFLLERVLEIISPDHILEAEIYHALEDHFDLCAAGPAYERSHTVHTLVWLDAARASPVN